MKFTAEKLEQAFTELLANEGFPHHLCHTILRNPDEVWMVADRDLQNLLYALDQRYYCTDIYNDNRTAGSVRIVPQ